MVEDSKVRLRYKAAHCSFLKKQVQAIGVPYPDGMHRIVNCQDKDTECFEHDCIFTRDGGEWPFPGSAADALEGS